MFVLTVEVSSSTALFYWLCMLRKCWRTYFKSLSWGREELYFLLKSCTKKLTSVGFQLLTWKWNFTEITYLVLYQYNENLPISESVVYLCVDSFRMNYFIKTFKSVVSISSRVRLSFKTLIWHKVVYKKASVRRGGGGGVVVKSSMSARRIGGG